MAHLAMLNASMSSLSLTRSCRRPGFGVSNGTLSHTCMRKKDTYHVEVSNEMLMILQNGRRRAGAVPACIARTIMHLDSIQPNSVFCADRSPWRRQSQQTAPCVASGGPSWRPT